MRYEHDATGKMLHIDTKKFGRIECAAHRATGNRSDSVSAAGWEMLFVVEDDHARIAFTAMFPDERTPQAVQFLRDAVANYAGLGVMVEQLVTDHGSAFRSKDFAQVCKQLGICHRSRDRRRCCINQVQAELPPTPDVATPWPPSADIPVR